MYSLLLFILFKTGVVNALSTSALSNFFPYSVLYLSIFQEKQNLYHWFLFILATVKMSLYQNDSIPNITMILKLWSGFKNHLIGFGESCNEICS